MATVFEEMEKVVFLAAVENKPDIMQELIDNLRHLFHEKNVPGHTFVIVFFESNDDLESMVKEFNPQMAIVDAEAIFKSEGKFFDGVEVARQLRENIPELLIMLMTRKPLRDIKVMQVMGDHSTMIYTKIFSKKPQEPLSDYENFKFAIKRLLDNLGIHHNIDRFFKIA